MISIMSEQNVVKLSAPLPVEVGLEDPMISDDELVKVLTRQGFSEVGLSRIQDIRACGVALKGLGVLKMQRGRALVSQQRMDNAMRYLADLLEEVMAGNKSTKISQAIRLAQALGYMGSKLTEAQAFLAEMERHHGSNRPAFQEAVSEVINKGFLPGKDVQPGVTLIQREAHIRPEHITRHEIRDTDGKKSG